MVGVLGTLSLWMITVVHVMFLVLAQDGNQFVLYDFRTPKLELDGMANTQNGPLHLTNDTETSTGHAFYKVPMNFAGSSFFFSTEFVFAILPLQSTAYGHGMAFVVSPTTDLRYGGSILEGNASRHFWDWYFDTVRRLHLVPTCFPREPEYRRCW